MGIDTGKDLRDMTSSSKSDSKSTKNTKKLQSQTARLDDTDLALQIIHGIDEIRQQASEIRKDIEAAVVPKFLNISGQTNDLVEHAIELWRMEQRLNKIVVSLDESQQNLLTNSIQKLKRYLNKNDIEIVDHTNQKFNDGRNLRVLLVEKSPTVTESFIKETKEPTILYKNQVIHIGRVIVLEGSDGGAKHG